MGPHPPGTDARRRGGCTGLPGGGCVFRGGNGRPTVGTMDTRELCAFDTPLALPPGRLLRLRPAGGACLRVLAGGVWLTCDGEPADHFLAAGARLDLPPHGRALLEVEPRIAAGAAVVVLERCAAPAPSATAPWWRGWLRPRPLGPVRLR